MSKGGRYLNTAKTRKGTWKDAVLAVEAVILIVMLAVGGGGYYFVSSKLALIQQAQRVETQLTQDQVDAILNYNPEAGNSQESQPETEPETQPEEESQAETEQEQNTDATVG